MEVRLVDTPLPYTSGWLNVSICFGRQWFAIFAVTAAALLISWVVSVYFVPYVGTLLLKAKPHSQGNVALPLSLIPAGDGRRQAAALGRSDGDSQPHELFDTPFYAAFRRLVNWCVAHRWITIALTVATLGLGVAGMGKVQNQFFPDSSRLEVLVDLWSAEGTSFASNEELTKRVEARIMKFKGVEHVTTWVGGGAERFVLVLDQIFPQSNVSQMIVQTGNVAACEELRLRLPEILATEFPEVRGRAKLLPNGPPVPYPVQFRVVGQEVAQVRAYADEVKAVLRANPNMRGVNDNWNEAVKVLRLEIDQDKARALGVSSSGIAQAARTINSGTDIGQYRDGDKLIDIVLRQPLEERDTLSDLGNAYVPTSSGRSIPLAQIAKARLAWEPGVLWREGRDYAATVQGDIVEGLQGATVTAQINPQLDAIRARLLPGYRIDIAGAVEESSKGQGSIAAGAPLMLFIMFTLLMLQLHSFSRSVLVFLTAPMGIAGVAAALLLLDRPFGFVALLGVIALMGMIMRNSVILIDQIEQDRARGAATWNAIVEAAVRRLRPIILTAAAAVLAMIPLSRSVFWGPMAVAIMGGLIVATALTLLALPALYAAWYRVKPPELEAAVAR